MTDEDMMAFATGSGLLKPVVLSCPLPGCHYGVIARDNPAKWIRYSHVRRHHLDESTRAVSAWTTWLAEQDEEMHD